MCANRTMCPLHHFVLLRFPKSQLASSICRYTFRCRVPHELRITYALFNWHMEVVVAICMNPCNVYCMQEGKTFFFHHLMMICDEFGCICLSHSIYTYQYQVNESVLQAINLDTKVKSYVTQKHKFDLS